MEVLFFFGIIVVFSVLSAVLPPVGGEGQRDLAERNLVPLGPLHHA